jgi:hypothetical protein
VLETLPGDLSDRDCSEVVQHADECHHAKYLEQDDHRGDDFVISPLGTAVLRLIAAAAPTEGIYARDVIQLIPAPHTYSYRHAFIHTGSTQLNSY